MTIYGKQTLSLTSNSLFSRAALLTLLLLISGCAEHYSIEAASNPYGFFSGIWHGIVAPYAVFANILAWILLQFDVKLYSEVNVLGLPNSGFAYYLGFILGLLSDFRIFGAR